MSPSALLFLVASTAAFAGQPADVPLGWAPGLVLDVRSTATITSAGTHQAAARAVGVITYRIEVEQGPGEHLSLMLRDAELARVEGDNTLRSRWETNAAWALHLRGLQITRDGGFVAPLDPEATAAAVAQAYPDLPAPPDARTTSAVAEQLWASLGGLAIQLAPRGDGAWTERSRLPMLVEGGSVPATMQVSRRAAQPCSPRESSGDCVRVEVDLTADGGAVREAVSAQLGVEVTEFDKAVHTEQIVGPDHLPVRTSSSTTTRFVLRQGGSTAAQTESQLVELEFTRAR